FYLRGPQPEFRSYWRMDRRSGHGYGPGRAGRSANHNCDEGRAGGAGREASGWALALGGGSVARRGPRSDAELWVLATAVWRGPGGDRGEPYRWRATGADRGVDAGRVGLGRHGGGTDTAVSVQSRATDSARLFSTERREAEAGCDAGGGQRRHCADGSRMDEFVARAAGRQSASLGAMEDHAGPSATAARRCRAY